MGNGKAGNGKGKELGETGGTQNGKAGDRRKWELKERGCGKCEDMGKGRAEKRWINEK